MVSKTLAGCFHGIGGNDTRTSSRDIFAHDKPGNRRHTITDVWGISFVLSWVLSRGQSCASLGRGWATPRAARKQEQTVTVATGICGHRQQRYGEPFLRSEKKSAMPVGTDTVRAWHKVTRAFPCFLEQLHAAQPVMADAAPASPGPGRECCSSWSTGSCG